MKNLKPKSEPAIVTTRKRIFTIFSVFICLFAFLAVRLFNLQILGYSYYKDKVYEQVTTSSALKAKRGNIYDSSMNPLALTQTSWRIFISTRDIKKAERESGKPYSSIIAKGLSEILDLDENKLYYKIKNSNVLDVTVKKSSNEDEYKRVVEFINSADLSDLVFTEAQSSRYYPASTLASQTIGFCGSDNQGLYGLEYSYDKILSGKDGYYLYAKDANGNTLKTEYSEYFPATDGYSIVTTLDSYLQETLESELESIVKNHMVENRATGIVMDTKTGAILAMATTSGFNLNSPYELDEKSLEKLEKTGYIKDSDEYKKTKRKLLELMWSNKAVSETYEPGSTFKIVTVAAALDKGVASMSDTFSCQGYHMVGGWRIRCHKITGHGSGFPLSYGLQMSCNPTMMKLAERIGAESFYDYVKSFGYFEKSGIDLPSEARTIFHDPSAIGPTELATASFGQRFKVSIINHLRAISVVANGGNLVTPYLVEKVIDSNGNIVSEHKPEIIRNVISKDVAATVADVLEKGVSADGGAKNARVDGYLIAAKTGTSQKFDILDENGNSYLRVSSTVAFAPSNESGIAIIIVADEPMSSVKYGSVVAAPYVSSFLEKALPYLDYLSTNESDNIEIGDYTGLSKSIAIDKLKELGVKYELIGDGDIIYGQTPDQGDKLIPALGKVILYTMEKESEYTVVPLLVGMDVAKAVENAINSGLNIKLSGAKDSGTVVGQSIPVGARVKKGSIIELNILICDFEG